MTFRNHFGYSTLFWLYEFHFGRISWNARHVDTQHINSKWIVCWFEHTHTHTMGYRYWKVIFFSELKTENLWFCGCRSRCCCSMSSSSSFSLLFAWTSDGWKNFLGAQIELTKKPQPYGPNAVCVCAFMFMCAALITSIIIIINLSLNLFEILSPSSE